MSATVTAPTDTRMIGSVLVRHDAVEKAAGRTRYAADRPLPGQLHAMLKRSDEAHARLVSVDTHEARRLPGIVSVLVAADVPHNTVWVDVPGQSVEVGALKAVQYILADDVVRYHGEPIALVAAESEDAALAALDAIEVTYEPLPVLSDPLQALAPDAPRLHPDGNLLAEWRIEDGEVDEALRSASVVVTDTYQTHFVDHAYLEPEAGTAYVDTDGVIVITCATQVIEHARDVARILGVDQNRVRVIAPYVGGGFGGKEDMTVEPYLALIAHLTRRPVRMIWSRQESLLARQNRHAVWMRYSTGADQDGHLVAQDIELVSDGGAYAFLSALVLLYSTTHAQGPYACPHTRIAARVVYTNHTPCSAFRGFGGMQVALGYEGQMDRLAAALRLDPLELRRRNFLKPGDVLAVGQRIETSVALPDLVNAVREQMGPAPEPVAGHAVGRGYACNLQSYGRCIWLNDWSSAWLGFELDGTLVIRIGVPDVGGGQASSLVQIASEVLGVHPDQITIHIGDSALTPLTGTTTATRQLYMSGNAVLKAARDLRERLAGVAATLLETDPERLVFTPAGVEAAGAAAQARVGFADLISACVADSVAWQQLSVFHAPKGEPWQAHSAWRGRVLPDFTYGCHAVDVAIDPATGQLRVLRYVAAHDVGRAINPQSVRGQIEGGVAMGLGYALSERVVFDRAQNLTGTFAQYLIPTAVELPDIEAVILESGEGLGPFSARGIGEPPVGPPAPALAAAIAAATGRWITTLPFTSERVASALAEEPA